MSQKSFTTTLSVDQSPKEVFEAVNDVRGWWSGSIEGRTDALGAEFTYRYKDLHSTTHRITEWQQGKKVAWHVMKSYIAFVADKNEWEGTEVVFEIQRNGDKTELRFTHVGLDPTLECYEKCSGGWGFFINQSLLQRITTGKGQPVDQELRLG